MTPTKEQLINDITAWVMESSTRLKYVKSCEHCFGTGHECESPEICCDCGGSGDFAVTQEPSLEDVLIAIDDSHWMVKHDAGMKRFEFVNMRDFGKKNFKNEYVPWNYGTLSQQSLETLQFIYSLAKKV